MKKQMKKISGRFLKSACNPPPEIWISERGKNPGRKEATTVSRERQRENRRLKHIAQNIRQKAVEKPWLNSEGYHDPTAYEALRRVERSERMQKAAMAAM